MIKQQLRKLVRLIAAWTLLGRCAKTIMGFLRLPEISATYLNSHQRLLVFQRKQLPRLLQTVCDLNHRLICIEKDNNGFVRSIPDFVQKTECDMVETRKQLEVLTNSVSYLLGRVEFIRRKLMFEMCHEGETLNLGNEQIKTKVEIINPGKVSAARNERLKINLGYGHIVLDGYLNVDRWALPGVDIVAEADELPFEPGEIDEIFSTHMLEYFSQEQLRRELLPYYYNLLKKGGVFRVVVPDAESMIKGYVNGTFPYSFLRNAMFSAHDCEGEFHFNTFVAEQIKGMLKEAGFGDIERLEKGRKADTCYQMEFKAVKK